MRSALRHKHSTTPFSRKPEVLEPMFGEIWVSCVTQWKLHTVYIYISIWKIMKICWVYHLTFQQLVLRWLFRNRLLANAYYWASGPAPSKMPKISALLACFPSKSQSSWPMSRCDIFMCWKKCIHVALFTGLCAMLEFVDCGHPLFFLCE